MRAVAPKTLPEMPEEAARWRRSTKRVGTMFHAVDYIGAPICRKAGMMDRNKSAAPDGLGDFQYWGVCPHCFKAGGNA